MILLLKILGIVLAVFFTILNIRESRRKREQRMMLEAAIHRETRGIPQRRSSEDFHDQVWLPLCQQIETHAIRLNCPLTPDQRRRIWRSRSPAILEDLLKQIERNDSPETLTHALSKLPPGLDRTDPTQWCETTP